MRTLMCVLVCFMLAAGMIEGQATQACLQDQYGNQYNFTVDSTDQYVYGSVTPSPTQCPGANWPLTGSYGNTSTGIGLELTAANPAGSSSGCVPMYTLKGVMPNFEWYYTFGVSNPPQPGTWVACGSSVSDKPTGKGAKK